MYSVDCNVAAFCIPQCMRELAWRKGHAGSALDSQDVEVRERGERTKKDKNREGKRIL